tara:strand:- start:39207 stop:39335 length:129 start_codon:yes stop_codon:yes gene_type:complete
MKTLFQNIEKFIMFKHPRDPLDILIGFFLWSIIILTVLKTVL